MYYCVATIGRDQKAQADSAWFRDETEIFKKVAFKLLLKPRPIWDTTARRWKMCTNLVAPPSNLVIEVIYKKLRLPKCLRSENKRTRRQHLMHAVRSIYANNGI